ncbi:MAG: replication initiation protein [Alphaproteobacteria bacterium]|nr:replication initiation protein [Alphaproteobacteria bacterium]
MKQNQKGKSIKKALLDIKKHAIDLNLWEGDNVIMSKALVNGIHEVELNGKRVLALAMSKVEQKLAKLNSDNALELEIQADEFSKIFGIEKQETYKAMLRGLKEVAGASVTLYSVHKETLSLQVEKMPWVKSIRYIEGNGKLRVIFNDMLTPHITRFVDNKTGGYTIYKIQQAGKLKSVYAWRLFELIMQFRDTGWYTTEIENLATQLEVPTSVASSFTRFKKYCLEPALKELREKCNIEIEYTATKSGKKFSRIEFKFKDNSSAQNPPKTTKTEEISQEVYDDYEARARLGMGHVVF